MYIEGLVFGLLARFTENSDPKVASRLEEANEPGAESRLRSITISWSRFGYHDRIIEGGCVNVILDKALELGYKYCLVQSYGHVIAENWYPKHWNHPDFQNSLRDWINSYDFLVTGHILGREDGWFGLDQNCLLVNLVNYEQFGKPRFDYPCDRAIQLPKPLRSVKEGHDAPRIERLEPSNETESYKPCISGWNFINISLKNDKTVYNFNREITDQEFYIDSGRLSMDEVGPGEKLKGLGDDGKDLSDDANEIAIRSIARTLANSKRGVFVCNIESYADIEQPPPAFKPPLSRLYCVAAGFKPNRILHTHGFDQNTEILFFDYSPNALNVRKLLDDEWDGEDYPRFVQYIFKKFPYPETFYHLWANLSPDQLDRNDVERFWQDEIMKWGDEAAIKNHWTLFRGLKRKYIRCNILTEQQKILDQIDDRPNSVIWWSNAFFTVYANWLYTIDEKKRFYDNWITGLAAKNPAIFIYGSDYNNSSVNSIQASAYLAYYSEYGGEYLNPYKLNRHEIRF